MEKKFVTEKELADRWSVKPQTLRQWRWQKRGPTCFKINGRVIYKIDDVKLFEEGNEILRR